MICDLSISNPEATATQISRVIHSMGITISYSTVRKRLTILVLFTVDQFQNLC